MTPSLTLLKRGLKTPTASVENAAHNPNAVRIELRPSKVHKKLIAAVSALSLFTSATSQLPWMYCAFVWLWTAVAVIGWHFNPQRILSLIDDSDTWVLMHPSTFTRVTYKHTEYCTANLIVMAFTSPSGKLKRVFVWRDAVTPPAFSWLTARMTLSDADAPVQNVATSSTNTFFHSHRGQIIEPANLFRR